ncbi:ATP-binding cassette domain-containing protein [Lactiplantibacillus daoliensis]|uniref:ATP-binding cassette domain-containing protein n=1 Tax=Lactiplantibacillus daoliensis TaxID=2559916 RepID=A0ABW1UHQ4_9LACO|nr:ATP-binding cassette domain-containing protein [Lactiplantibacillus daoliensis]
MNLIELQNVSRSFSGKKLLNDVSFSVEKGSITTLEGINGSGKTLILKAILGLIKVSGNITVNRKRVLVSGRYPVQAGVLIEKPSLLNEFSAFKNLQLITDLLESSDDDMIKELLIQFDLPIDKKTKVKKFSLGMKQKLGIAQAMIGGCELIVLDEPTNALDEESIAKLIVTIRQMREAGSTFIITSHDREFIEAIATRRIGVRDGATYEVA